MWSNLLIVGYGFQALSVLWKAMVGRAGLEDGVRYLDSAVSPRVKSQSRGFCFMPRRQGWQ